MPNGTRAPYRIDSGFEPSPDHTSDSEDAAMDKYRYHARSLLGLPRWMRGHPFGPLIFGFLREDDWLRPRLRPRTLLRFRSIADTEIDGSSSEELPGLAPPSTDEDMPALGSPHPVASSADEDDSSDDSSFTFDSLPASRAPPALGPTVYAIREGHQYQSVTGGHMIAARRWLMASSPPGTAEPRAPRIPSPHGSAEPRDPGAVWILSPHGDAPPPPLRRFHTRTHTTVITANT